MRGYEMGRGTVGMYASMAGKGEASHNRSDTIGEIWYWDKKRLINDWHTTLSLLSKLLCDMR